MTEMAESSNIDANVDQKRKEAYFTASQGQLIWTRFKKQIPDTLECLLVWLTLLLFCFLNL